jgi:hypothetical protein
MEIIVEGETTEELQRALDRKVVQVSGLEVANGLPVPKEELSEVASEETEEISLVSEVPWRARVARSVFDATNLILYSAPIDYAERGLIGVNNLPPVRKVENLAGIGLRYAGHGLGVGLRGISRLAETGIYKFIEVVDGEQDITTQRAVKEATIFATGVSAVIGFFGASIPMSQVDSEHLLPISVGAAVAVGAWGGYLAHGYEVQRLQGIDVPKSSKVIQMIFGGIDYYVLNIKMPKIDFNYSIDPSFKNLKRPSFNLPSNKG